VLLKNNKLKSGRLFGLRGHLWYVFNAPEVAQNHQKIKSVLTIVPRFCKPRISYFRIIKASFHEKNHFVWIFYKNEPHF